MKITKSQLIETIEKEVRRLNQISLMESRLTELNRERKILSERTEGGLFEGDLPDELKAVKLEVEKLSQNFMPSKSWVINNITMDTDANNDGVLKFNVSGSLTDDAERTLAIIGKQIDSQIIDPIEKKFNVQVKLFHDNDAQDLLRGKIPGSLTYMYRILSK